MLTKILAFLNMDEDQLRRIFKAFNRFMVVIWRLGLGSWGNRTKYTGNVMVIKHKGRKTGLTRYTPVNYAVVNGDIYCSAGFGRVSDWYQNIGANPEVEVWLPDGRWLGIADDVSDSEEGPFLLRQVIIGSGFAAYLFGLNPKRLSDKEFEGLLKRYRLIRIRCTRALTGPEGPGDLAWIWPISTLVLLCLLLRRKRK